MWALPNIKDMNDRAVAEYEAGKHLTRKQTLKGQKCMYCDGKATVYYDYYDIFSDVPKGKVFLCEDCEGYYGDPAEGYFRCEACERVMVESYTWEVYFHDTDEGRVCLNCYFDKEIAKPENWIDKVELVTWERIRGVKHLIPVAGEHWREYLDFHGNEEFDSMTGETLAGFSSTVSKDVGIGRLKEIVTKALEKGPVMLILDAGYQFAVSIGVYTRKV